MPGCSSAAIPPGTGPRIAFLFDGSWDDADEVTGPALAGLRFAALGTGDDETIRPVNVAAADADEELREVAGDRGVVAAVAAPWTAAPEGAADLLAEAGVPVVSLGWAWGPPAGDGAWASLAVDLAAEADLLLRTSERTIGPGERRCVAGDTHATSSSLTAALLAAAEPPPSGPADAGTVDPDRAATAEAVAAHVIREGCTLLLWTGGAETLAPVLDAAPGLRTVVGTSRLKTEGGIAVGVTHPARRILAICACADVALSGDPDLMRFVHDFASESGGAPGAFAVEAYDAGRAILAAAEGSPDARTAVVGALEEHGLEGLLGRYRLEVDGSLLEAPAPPHAWRAFGSRWLPVGGPLALLPLTALPAAMLLARVPPRTGPDGPSNVHRTGEET